MLAKAAEHANMQAWHAACIMSDTHGTNALCRFLLHKCIESSPFVRCVQSPAAMWASPWPAPWWHILSLLMYLLQWGLPTPPMAVGSNYKHSPLHLFTRWTFDEEQCLLRNTQTHRRLTSYLATPVDPSAARSSCQLPINVGTLPILLNPAKGWGDGSSSAMLICCNTTRSLMPSLQWRAAERTSDL